MDGEASSGRGEAEDRAAAAEIDGSIIATRNGRLRKIPKKVQKFGLHPNLTGQVLGQQNGATIRFLFQAYCSFDWRQRG
jgi:hypothetical protein